MRTNEVSPQAWRTISEFKRFHLPEEKCGQKKGGVQSAPNGAKGTANMR